MIFAARLASLAFAVPQSDYQISVHHQRRLVMLSWIGRPVSSAEAPGSPKLSERSQVICEALPLASKIKHQSSSDHNEVTGVRCFYLQTNPTLRISLQHKRRVYIHFLLIDEGYRGSSCPLHNIFLCSCLQEKEIHPK